MEHFKRSEVAVAKVYAVNGPQLRFEGGEKTAVVYFPLSKQAKSWIGREAVRKSLPTTAVVEVGTMRSKKLAVLWDGRDQETAFLAFLDQVITANTVVEIG